MRGSEPFSPLNTSVDKPCRSHLKRSQVMTRASFTLCEVSMNSSASALSLGQIIGLVTFALSMATGQVLFKLGATRVEPATDLSGWMNLIFHPLVITALTLYGAATFLWLWLLQRIPLTTAYPFAALAFVLVPLGGWLFFNESVNAKYVMGVALILGGVLLTSLSR